MHVVEFLGYRINIMLRRVDEGQRSVEEVKSKISFKSQKYQAAKYLIFFKLKFGDTSSFAKA